MAKNYVAKITGKHPKWKFNRDFVYSGFLKYPVKGKVWTPEKEFLELEDGLYEVATGLNNKYKDYIVVRNGELKEISFDEAMKIAEEMGE